MNAALLCPGPSLAGLLRIPACDVSIGVNRSCLRFPCDWWAALDYQMLRSHEALILGNPRLLTRAEYRPKYSARPGLDVQALDGPTCAYATFSATAALVLAANLGATAIDVYGCDRTSGGDFDGVTPEHARRDSQRWECEGRIWDEAVAWLAGKGVTVRRN